MPTPSVTILQGDVRDVLSTLPDDHFDCCVTSPPYWGLRDYGVEGQIGLEPTLTEYLETMVDVCRGVRRVLKPEGTFWLNIGDSYTSGGRKTRDPGQSKMHTAFVGEAFKDGLRPSTPEVMKSKDLMMVPNRLAILLQDDGWYVRSEIIWHKPNPMPESVRDRPTSAHEKVWLLTKSERYFYDAMAIREVAVAKTMGDFDGGAQKSKDGTNANIGRYFRDEDRPEDLMRNARNVWSIATQPFKEAHFAVFPPKLAERCVLAGSPEGGRVLDPFGGAGTTGLVAHRLGRDATLIELNAAYIDIAQRRIGVETPVRSGVFA